MSRHAAVALLAFLGLANLLEPRLLADERTVFDTKDSLSPGEETSADARTCLEGLIWKPTGFQVTCESSRPGHAPAFVYFPSPISTGIKSNDTVSMEWFPAHGKDRKPLKAPAVVVVHESGSAMTVGRIFARGLQQNHLHAFLIHLP
ncbi:MAG: hypothetical protein H8E37_02205 [Planctomycetes bacterium]|nr:hypothetical protein [Planctomycetota bacterium]